MNNPPYVGDDQFVTLLKRLEEAAQRMERAAELLSAQPTQQEFYTVSEAAKLFNRKPYTVREWCRLGRLNATKALSGRGIDEEWRISHDEFERWRREGLLAMANPYRFRGR